MPPVASIRFLLAGSPQCFRFEITETDADRLYSVLQGSALDEGCRFFVFPSPSGVEVAVSLRDLQLLNFYGGMDDRPAEGGEAPGGEPIRVYCRGRAEPFEADAGEPLEVYDAMQYLRIFDALTEPFLHFLDEEGEPVVFRPDQVVLVTVPRWYIEQGREDSDAEDAEAAAELEKRRKQETRQLKSRRRSHPKETAPSAPERSPPLQESGALGRSSADSGGDDRPAPLSGLPGKAAKKKG
jgi:hypothetical protein